MTDFFGEWNADSVIVDSLNDGARSSLIQAV